MPGKESSAVSVFVDGRYHSDVVVANERTDPYSVNIGSLPAGKHRVEIRSAVDLAAKGAAAAVVTGEVAVGTTSGVRALVDRYQPLLEQRDLGRPQQQLEATRTDTPMLMAAAVVPNADGTRTINYYAMFSNEDGGTAMPKLVRETGRAVDYEPVFAVKVDKAGNRVGVPKYQGPSHKRYEFQGQWQGDRPLLRVATDNNNFSPGVTKGGSFWSEGVLAPDLRSFVPKAPAGSFAELSNNPTWLTDALVMRANPWTYALMGKEMLRENRVVADRPGSGQVKDMRQLVYLGPVGVSPARRILQAGKPVTLKLRDGRTIDLKLNPDDNGGIQNAALPLPKGVRGTDVAGLVGTTGDVWVLDDSFAPVQIGTGPGVPSAPEAPSVSADASAAGA